MLGALLYCFSFSILPFLLPGFSASVERRKMPSYTWFNLNKGAVPPNEGSALAQLHR